MHAGRHIGVGRAARIKATRIMETACVNAATSAMSAFRISEPVELCPQVGVPGSAAIVRASQPDSRGISPRAANRITSDIDGELHEHSFSGI